MRYWDGQSWTMHVQPAQNTGAPMAGSGGGMGATPSGAYQGSGGRRGVRAKVLAGVVASVLIVGTAGYVALRPKSGNNIATASPQAAAAELSSAVLGISTMTMTGTFHLTGDPVPMTMTLAMDNHAGATFSLAGVNLAVASLSGQSGNAASSGPDVAVSLVDGHLYVLVPPANLLRAVLTLGQGKINAQQAAEVQALTSVAGKWVDVADATQAPSSSTTLPPVSTLLSELEARAGAGSTTGGMHAGTPTTINGQSVVPFTNPKDPGYVLYVSATGPALPVRMTIPHQTSGGFSSGELDFTYSAAPIAAPAAVAMPASLAAQLAPVRAQVGPVLATLATLPAGYSLLDYALARGLERLGTTTASLQSSVSNSQLLADQSTALNIAHAAYFNAQSVYPAATVGITGTNAYDYTQQVIVNSGSGVTSVAAGTKSGSTNAWFQFANDGVCVTTTGYPALVRGVTTQATC